MGFASGTVSFRRYRIARWNFDAVDEKMLDALNAHAFGRHGAAAGELLEVGWICLRHLFDVNFAVEKVALGPYVHCAMRTDRNSPPAAILRSYVEIEQEAAREASGHGRLTKEDRRQAQDAAAARAEKEARSGAFRRVAAVPLLIDVENAALFFGSTGVGANERLQRLFEATFDAQLEPVGAHELAVRIAASSGQQRALEDARPTHFVTPPDDPDAYPYCADPTDRSFLGREFLTWLWYRVECAEEVIELLTRDDATLSITRVMRLCCDFALSGETEALTDGPGSSPECRAALSVGKQPRKMGLMLATRAGEWDFVLHAVDLCVTRLALPPAEHDDAVARLEARFEGVTELARAIDQLFEQFVRLRLSGDWAAAAREITQWAAAGRVPRTPVAVQRVPA